MGEFAGDQLSKFGRTQVGSWDRVLKVHVAHAEVTSSPSLCLSLSLSLALSLSLSLSRSVARSARSIARAYFAPHAGALFLGVRFHRPSFNRVYTSHFCVSRQCVVARQYVVATDTMFPTGPVS